MKSENFQRHLRFSRSITCYLVVSETKHHVAMKNQELYVIFIKEIKLWETPQNGNFKQVQSEELFMA